MPRVYKAVQSAKLRVGGRGWMKAKDASGAEKTVGAFSWVDAMECAYDLGEGEDFRVVSLFSWDASEDGGRYDGAFATSFEVSDAKRALVVAAWGRNKTLVRTADGRNLLAELSGGAPPPPCGSGQRVPSRWRKTSAACQEWGVARERAAWPAGTTPASSSPRVQPGWAVT